MANPKTKGKPFWFKLYMDDANLIRISGSKAIADAIKALLCLMEDPAYDAAGLSKPALMLYSQLRRGVDEATEEYKRASAAGKKGNEVRWGKASPPDRPPIYADPEPEPYQYQEPYLEHEQDLYQERKEEQEPLVPLSFLPEGIDENGFMPWENKLRSLQLEDLKNGLITINELIRFPGDVSWPPESARNYV